MARRGQSLGSHLRPPALAALLAVWLGLLMAAGQAAAEDGSDLWLRYRPVEPAWAARYRPEATEIVSPMGSPVQAAAVAELDRGLKGLLGRARPTSRGWIATAHPDRRAGAFADDR